MRMHISDLLSKGFFLLVFETFVINHPEIKYFLTELIAWLTSHVSELWTSSISKHMLKRIRKKLGECAKCRSEFVQSDQEAN